MTTLELQEWKKNFIEDYLNEIKVVSPSPIAYSVDEALKEIDVAERELNEGKGVNEAEMHQFFGEWKRKLQ